MNRLVSLEDMEEFVSYASNWPPSGQLHVLAGIALMLGLGKGGVPGLATIATAATGKFLCRKVFGLSVE